MRRTERLHALTELLRRAGPRGVTAAALAERLEVSPRTVKRDLAALERAGLPVWGRPGPGGGYGLAEAATLPPITLTPAQAVAVAAAVHAAADAPFADLARAGVEKILDALDPATRTRARNLGARVWVDAPRVPPRRVLSTLEAAMVDQVVVRIGYRDAAGVATRRDVEPMLFAATGGGWYLVAWCRWREAVRWFALERVTSASATRGACSGHGIDEVGEPPTSARPVL